MGIKGDEKRMVGLAHGKQVEMRLKMLFYSQDSHTGNMIA